MSAVASDLPKTVGTGERAQLSAIAESLKASVNEWAVLAASEKTFSETLSARVEKVRVLEISTEPDGDSSAILDLLVERVRLEKQRSFLADVPQQQKLLTGRIANAFANLNLLMEKFNDERFFLAGSRPDSIAIGALHSIEKILAEK